MIKLEIKTERLNTIVCWKQLYGDIYFFYFFYNRDVQISPFIYTGTTHYFSLV